MARKSLRYTVDAEGRDKGKTFVITEMSSASAERWALKALSALVASGMEIPDNVAQGGIAAVAKMGIQAFGGIAWDRAEPLLQEMFACIQIQPGQNTNVVRGLIDDDIEEVATRIRLRIVTFDLHVGFSATAAQLTSA